MRTRHRREEERVEGEAASLAEKLDQLAPPKALMSRYFFFTNFTGKSSNQS